MSTTPPVTRQDVATDSRTRPGVFSSIEQAQEAHAIAQARNRRRRLLRWSTPFVVVVVVAALYLLGLAGVVMIGERSYAGQSYPSAVRQFSLLQHVNVLERWKPYYNSGTARYSSGAFFTATQELERAMELVPRGAPEEGRSAEECLVATNLSLAYEGLGDEAARASDPAMAIAYYEQALATIAGCGTAGGGGGSQEQQESADQAEERQQDKQQEQQEQQEQDSGGQGGESEPDDGDSSPDDGQQDSEDPADQEDSNSGEDGQEQEQDPESDPSGEASQTPTPDPYSEQQRELEERNREAQEQREQEQQESGGGSGGGQGW